MLALFMVTAIVFFSTTVYFWEKDHPDSHFDRCVVLTSR